MKYKLNSEKCSFVIAKQSKGSRKIYLAVTRQITQEDINLLLDKNNYCQVFSRSRNGTGHYLCRV